MVIASFLQNALRSVYAIGVCKSGWHMLEGGSVVLIFKHERLSSFLLELFLNCVRKTWFKSVGGSPSKC